MLQNISQEIQPSDNSIQILIYQLNHHKKLIFSLLFEVFDLKNSYHHQETFDLLKYTKLRSYNYQELYIIMYHIVIFFYFHI